MFPTGIDTDFVAFCEEVCRGFYLDNSAFTYWRSGEQLPFDDVVDWYRAYYRHPRFLHAFIPDVIDGTEKQNDEMITRYVDCVPRHLWTASVPVWHMHESFARLDRLIAEWPVVAIGSSGSYKTPGSALWTQRMDEAFTNVISGPDGLPRTKIHGLRMLSPKIVGRYPFYSCDSTNASANAGSHARFGMYKPPSRHVRAMVIADRIEAVVSPSTWRFGEQTYFDFGGDDNV